MSLTKSRHHPNTRTLDGLVLERSGYRGTGSGGETSGAGDVDVGNEFVKTKPGKLVAGSEETIDIIGSKGVGRGTTKDSLIKTEGLWFAIIAGASTTRP